PIQYLPKVFLQRLWLLNQDARTPCVQPRNDAPNIDFKSAEDMLSGIGEDSQSIINPLDLVTSVFMSSNPFLQQEIAVHMMQCQFAVPLVLPNIDPEKSGKFLLWPLRGVTSKWKSHSLETIGRVHEAHLATTDMPTFSCVKLGHLGVSKSQVLNHVLNGRKFSSETFVHRGMNGAQMPRRLSNGLVEIGWYVPCGEAHDVFPVPVAISNLRGNASAHEKCLQLLCKASSVLVVFCGNLQEKEKQLLVTCKEMASKLILIDFSDTEISDNRAAEFVKLPRESLDMNVDEGPACRKAMAAVEEVLKGFDEGSEKFQMKQLPLQGALWSKLSELDKEESKQRKRGNEPDPILQKEKKDVLTSLNNYKMTPAMKIFTDSLFTTDKMERAYFLHWLKLKLYLIQAEKQDAPTDNSSSSAKQIKHNMSQENCVSSCSETLAPDSLSLGVENFLREMGLIFELTHTGPNSKTQNVLRLPSAAADLLLYGVPLELMDGNASNIPKCWLSCVFAELKRRLPQEQLRTRVLTNIGRHNANHQDFFSTLFGVKFPTRRGMYIAALDVPINLRQELGCDFLFLINVVGLYSSSADNKHNRLMYDNEMATVATAVSDILMLNCSPQNGRQNETPFAVMVNALLRCKEYGSLPIYQLLVQDEGIHSKLQTFQMRRVYNVLKAKNRDKESTNDNNLSTANSATFVKGPQPSMFFSEPVDIHYSTAMLSLKEEMFKALKRCATSKLSALPEFMRDVCAVWEAVKSDSFSIDLQDKDSALAFSLLCTEFSLWEDTLLENMESWLMEATKKIFATNASTLNTDQNDVLSCLNNEAREEIKSEVNKIKLNLEAYLMKDDSLRRNVEMFTEILMSNIANFQDQVTKEIFQKLETVSETHCSSRQMKKFENLLQEKQEFKLLALSETSKSTKILFQDAELEEEFEVVWTKTLSNFDFRPSEADDITFRVREVLKLNLISRGLYKHLKKLDDVGKNQTSDFQINDEHFGYRIRLKHILPADFSDSYIEELLENVEKALQEKSMEIRSVFEVDLKIYLCNAACQDFQKLHDRFAKDRELLSYVSETKSKCQAEFIYNFRKRDQCQRIAEAFVSMVIKPTVLDYIYRPLGMHIVEEIKEKSKECQSPQAFHKSLLEELVKEDDFESFKEYLMSYDNFRLKKIQEKVVAYLSESSALGKWRQQKLGEIIGKVAAAVNQTPEVTDGVLSETKPLLEKICLTLEKDAGVYVSRAALNGPLFSITTEWDRFLKHLMELLASIRMDLSQEFSQNVDITQLLHSLSVQPQEYLFNTVRSCDNRCPLCKAPCVEEALGHGVHKPLLHWPICMLPIDSHSQSCVSCCDNQTPGHNSDAQGMYHACKDLQSLYPNWSNPLDDTNSQNTSDYWRYGTLNFHAQFHQEPAKIPEEWKKITQQEALESLREIVPTREC
uniref:GTPase, very large interferon inducible 1-like 2 n=1 Tax=Oryzias melastigma TaxID=30732 RepID=A0A3B3C4H5_ORYME